MKCEALGALFNVIHQCNTSVFCASKCYLIVALKRNVVEFDLENSLRAFLSTFFFEKKIKIFNPTSLTIYFLLRLINTSSENPRALKSSALQAEKIWWFMGHNH